MSNTPINAWVGLPSGTVGFQDGSSYTAPVGPGPLVANTPRLLFAANPFRKGWKVFACNFDILVNESGGNAVSTDGVHADPGTLIIYQGYMYESQFGGASPNAISIASIHSGATYTAAEW